MKFLIFLCLTTLCLADISLKWTHDDPDCKFIVEQKLNNSNWTRVRETKDKEIKIKTRGNGDYSFRVIATRNGVEASPSEEISIRIKEKTPEKKK